MTTPTRPHFRRRTLGFATALAAGALALAACGSSGGSTTTTSGVAGTTGGSTTTPANAAAQLASMETPPSAHVSLTEDGSSLLYPLYQAWVSAFHTAHSSISSSSGNDGSGTGISDAESGVVNIGASDAYLPPATYSQYPTLENIPVAISAQVVAYNLPGMSSSHLKLDAKVLNDMYDGTVKSWNDPAIRSLNPGANLPNIPVVPIHRSDSSGDTFLFTSYLAAADPSGWAPKNGGPAPDASFPSVSGALAEKGNSGMVSGCGATKGCVAYIGISYLSDMATAKLGYGQLENKSGKFLLPTASSIKAEAAAFPTVPASGSISMIDGPASNGYPIINFEYLIVKTNQSSATTAKAIKALIAWAMDPHGGNGASYLNAVDFQPLSASGLSVAVNLLKKIS